jgi:hypothetical protein
MFDDPSAGRGLRAPERSRMLVATEDGVFLWPGTPLVYRRGQGFFAAEPRAANTAMGCFFGPAVIDLPTEAVLERARDELRNGRVGSVQQMLDRLPLPPVSPNGARLMRAIAGRQALSMPDVTVASHHDGTIWNGCDVELFARLHDNVAPQARRLEKVFNLGSAWDPATHPRWPAGESDGGEFAPAGEGDGSAFIPASVIRPPWSRPSKKPLGDAPQVPAQEPGTG